MTLKHNVFLSGGNTATPSQFSQDSYLTEKERTEVNPLTTLVIMKMLISSVDKYTVWILHANG